MPAVSDSSPLILYAAIGRLDVLRAVYQELLVPPAVWREVVENGRGRAGSSEVAEAPWIRQEPLPTAIPDLPALAALHAGEADAIVLALSTQPRIPILVDDRRARRVALDVGLAVVGSGGVAVLAKRMGFVSSARPLLSALRGAGLYLSDTAMEQSLTRAGE